MGFLSPLALLALPLAAVPWILAWQGRRRGEPVRFSSLYLVERARERARRRPARSRWVVWLRCLVVLLLVLAAARPVGPGAGSPALHRPTRAVVAVDVSGSVRQRVEGRRAWAAVVAAADSLLAWAGPEDEVALAAVADGLVGWWEAPPATLRRRLAALEPTARASDWPAVLSALAGREEPGSETYLVTDGSSGGRGPDGRSYDVEPTVAERPRRVVRPVGTAVTPNRALTGARRTADGGVALAGRAWGPGAPEVAEAGRRVGGTLVERRPIALDGEAAGPTWAAPDTATFALAGADPLPEDDAWRVAPGLTDGTGYRVARWTPADEPPDPGPLFWEAAIEALGRPVTRHAALAALAQARPDLALLPLRRYGAGDAGLLAALAAGGARLVFVPECAEPACAPPAGWAGAGGPELPDVAAELPDPDRRTTLAPGPVGGAGGALPEILLDRAPVRGAWRPVGADAVGRRWDLASGAPAAWASGSALLWLVPLGPPVTRLAETPLFPIVVDRLLGAWDPRWSAGAGGVAAGAPLPVPAAGAVVTGPLGADDPATWTVPAGGAGPAAERPGLYRVAPSDVRDGAGAANFVAVNGDPAEGDPTPVPAADWSAWGTVAATDDAWRRAAFGRRRGPDLWPWVLALALTGLAAEAALRRAPTGAARGADADRPE